jgi:hypothetical protein
LFNITDVRRLAVGALLLGTGVLAGAALNSTGAARAEVQSAAQPQHFQSASQLSAPVLKEIAATLKQIDARVAHIEAAAQQVRPARINSAPGN